MTPKLEMIRMFFDTPAVMKRLSDMERKCLSKIGSFVMTGMRRLIRRTKTISSAGHPPSSHSGDLRDNIYFALSSTGKNVIVGPAKLNMIYWNDHGRPESGTVPEVLEKGGAIRVLEYLAPWGKWERLDLRSRRRAQGYDARGEGLTQARPQRLRAIPIEARPYAAPALENERRNGKLQEAWRSML